MSTALDIDVLQEDLAALADADRAATMAAYLKDQFPFYGIPTPVRRRATAWTKRVARAATADEVVAFCHECWARPEREFHYCASDLLGWNVAKLRPAHLADLEYFITHHSWWDTVDALASWSVGGLVATHRQLAEVMDDWIERDNVWLARTAILHQLRYKQSTDLDRLVRYADLRAGDKEFFIRKALGWALRQYAHTDPEPIRAYVAANGARLSGLTKREALKNIAPRP